MLPAICIRAIPSCEHRYPTCGDWWEDDDPQLGKTWNIRVTSMADWRHSFLVALHELVEMALCEQQGIAEPDVLAFDRQFEANRQLGNTDAPGDDPNAPYRHEHRFAENIERLVAAELDVVWSEYDRAVGESS